MRRLHTPLTPEHDHESQHGLGFGRLHIRDLAGIGGSANARRHGGTAARQELTQLGPAGEVRKGTRLIHQAITVIACKLSPRRNLRGEGHGPLRAAVRPRRAPWSRPARPVQGRR